jgi:hypothetical protein
MDGIQVALQAVFTCKRNGDAVKVIYGWPLFIVEKRLDVHIVQADSQ